MLQYAASMEARSCQEEQNVHKGFGVMKTKTMIK